ncbi:Acyl-CoA dehydrogenase family member 11 [Curvularia clavata]|uniref:Acyl-CoA dehydrogenase family member 11 n=1 Tax=Curvularia clavata TaxID=95742 RepID=A0A9Q8Z3T9_CURCL|nr:Acyl-CoA dehydrogenase family member 11 [Curvularia clavata]
MSVPYDRAFDLLSNSQNGHIPASKRIPAIARPFVSERAAKTLDIVEKFVEEECIPADAVYVRQLGQTVEERFSAHPSIIEDLKKRAQELGLWNMFLPKAHFKEGAGFSNLEYGLMAEYLGKSRTASEAVNCAAPDTGNMEVIAKYGSEAQKRQWLDPLLQGKIRSAFLMTEPQVASSDATNIEMSIKRDGDHYVLNGQKWWSSGIGDPRCKILIVLGKTDPNNADKYKQQSVILVPNDTPGVTVHRMLSVMGFDDAPHGHGHVTFENVRVPASNMVLGEGRGFEIIQGRLGPGRIHHAMRSIGSAEKALEWFLARINDERKKPFGQMLNQHGIMLERVARARIEIDAARLAVCNAAIQIDQTNAKGALKEIAEVKVLVPEVNLKVIDWAIQAYGGAGVSQETPLAQMWASGRTMRIVDGPDEVHLLQLGRNENKRGPAHKQRLEAQKKKGEELCRKYGIEPRDPLYLNRKSGEASKL